MNRLTNATSLRPFIVKHQRGIGDMCRASTLAFIALLLCNSIQAQASSSVEEQPWTPAQAAEWSAVINPTGRKPSNQWLFRHWPSSTEKQPRRLLFTQKKPIRILFKFEV